MIGSLIAAGAALGSSLYSAYQKNKHKNDQGNSLRDAAGLSGANAGLYAGLAGVYSKSAKAYLGAAETAGKIGLANAANVRRQAAQLDRYEQRQLEESLIEARRRIGLGRSAFAANGVLVDSGATALWEQDEAADAALERLDIMQQFEDEGWQLMVRANQVEAEGWANASGYAANAAGMFGQAAGSMGQAQAASLQSYAYMRQARAADRANRHAWLSDFVQGIGSAATIYAML